MNETIQGLWVGSELTPIEQLSLRSFLRHGHAVHLYTYEPLRSLPDGVTVKDAEEILPRSNVFSTHNGSYAIFADKFRYKLLYEKGGCWADIDFICLSPFDFGEEYVFATEATLDEKLIVNNGVMKLPSQSDVMAACYDVCCSQDIANLPWGTTGPQLLHKMAARYDLERFMVAPEVFNPIPWWQVERLVAPEQNAIEISSLYSRSKAIHLWNSMWGRRDLDKHASYPSSLYDALSAAYRQ